MQSGAVRRRTQQGDGNSAMRRICFAISNRELSTIVSNRFHSYKLEIIPTGEFLRG